jgi:hypothetical protein
VFADGKVRHSDHQQVEGRANHRAHPHDHLHNTVTAQANRQAHERIVAPFRPDLNHDPIGIRLAESVHRERATVAN